MQIRRHVYPKKGKSLSHFSLSLPSFPPSNLASHSSPLLAILWVFLPRFLRAVISPFDVAIPQIVCSASPLYRGLWECSNLQVFPQTLAVCTALQC